METFLKTLAHEFNPPFQNSVLVFAVILFIILLSPLLLRKIRIPGIIGLIISGVIVGPHGLNLIERNSAIELFSTIGLLYIMFMAGLELDLNRFMRNRYKSILFGFFTFAIPFVIGFPVAYYYLDYDLTASLLIAAMFSTHTLVAYPIVTRLGIARTEAIAITVGGTIFTDTAVLILLAVITASTSGELNAAFWLRLSIAFMIFLFVVMYLVPKVSAWFFRKLESEKMSHFVFVLSMVFLSAFVAEMAGLEPIIGAFAAGLALNRLIPHTSALMNRIDFAGNSLFIPFFLISVGMLVDLSVLANGHKAVLIAVVLTVVALIGKWVAAWATAFFLNYSATQRQLIFGLSASHAAAILAVIMVGYNLGIVDENVLNGTIVLILITCLTATFVTEKAARKMVLEQTDVDSNPELPTQEQRILVPIANPETMECLIELAMAIRHQDSRTPITGLAVVPDNDQASQRIVEARQMLQKAQIIGASVNQTVNIIATIDQNVASGIKRVATELFISDIIIGFPRKNILADIIFGSTVQFIIHQTTQTILMGSVCGQLQFHRQIVLVCPLYIEKDPGFFDSLDRVVQLSVNLSLKILIYASPTAEMAIKQYLGTGKSNTSAGYKTWMGWDHLNRVLGILQPSDLLIPILPRNGTLAFTPRQNEALREISDSTPNSFSFIIIYPGSSFGEHFGTLTHDFDAQFVHEGVNRISRSARHALSKGFWKRLFN